MMGLWKGYIDTPRVLILALIGGTGRIIELGTPHR